MIFRSRGDMPSLSIPSSTEERSSKRSTTASPWSIGITETRTSISRPEMMILMRPSCGTRFSAMSSLARIFRRETMAAWNCLTSAAMEASWSTPSMR